ncbi:MAG TPA: HEAT repeat domain-containing protein [Nitrospiraceae bacterium]|nr:HEAT repeat domain-containing protein [Nitrospiraceae bacterium]
MQRSLALHILILLFFLGVLTSPASAYREYFTPEQKAQLEKIQTVLVETIALTDKGGADSAPLTEVVSRRLGELSYTVVQDSAKPHDVLFRVKCEQRKTWEGTTAAGGDADLPDAPSRLWKGPACQLTYVLGGMKIKWQKEVRTDFEDAVAAAQKAQAAEPGAYAIGKLKEALEKYEFPLLLAAEWGQPDRLLKLLDSPDTSQARKVKIFSLLGEMQADEALPKLKEALKDRDLAKQALVAMGNLGKDGIPLLVDIMNTSPQPEIQAAAAKGLGQIGGINGDASVVLPLLAKLQDPKTDWAVLTEVAWALGKIPDKRSIQPLYDIDKKLQAIRDPDNVSLKKLKEAVFWAIKQCDTWDQYS